MRLVPRSETAYLHRKNARTPVKKPCLRTLMAYSILVLPGPDSAWQSANISWYYSQSNLASGSRHRSMGSRSAHPSSGTCRRTSDGTTMARDISELAMCSLKQRIEVGRRHDSRSGNERPVHRTR